MRNYRLRSLPSWVEVQGAFRYRTDLHLHVEGEILGVVIDTIKNIGGILLYTGHRGTHSVSGFFDYPKRCGIVLENERG